MSTPKFVEARRQDGVVVSALTLDRQQWDALQREYAIGELLLPCGCAAVPKTSPLGNAFFAHLAGTCETAPETQFHVAAKALVHHTAASLGFKVDVEEAGATDGARWRADVLIEHAGRKVAVEVQRSYQHLRDFQDRQARYREGDVLSVWLLDVEGYRRLCKSTARHRLRTEFGGRVPKGGYFPCLADLPVAFLEFEPEVLVKGARHFSARPEEWLCAIMADRFTWDEGAWRILRTDSPEAATCGTGPANIGPR